MERCVCVIFVCVFSKRNSIRVRIAKRCGVEKLRVWICAMQYLGWVLAALGFSLVFSSQVAPKSLRDFGGIDLSMGSAPLRWEARLRDRPWRPIGSAMLIGSTWSRLVHIYVYAVNEVYLVCASEIAGFGSSFDPRLRSRCVVCELELWLGHISVKVWQDLCGLDKGIFIYNCISYQRMNSVYEQEWQLRASSMRLI